MRNDENPQEKAYRRGVYQTIALLRRKWETNPPPTVQAAMTDLFALERKGQEMRYTKKDIPFFLNELLG